MPGKKPKERQRYMLRVNDACGSYQSSISGLVSGWKKRAIPG